MRSPILSHRQRGLCQVALIALVAGLAGCSSDFTRFDRNLYAALPQSQNQQASNPYPGDIDPTTTASIRSPHPKPLGAVEQSHVVADHSGYQPGNANAYPAGRQPLNTYRPAPAKASSVTKASLPKPTVTNRQADIDPISTSSVNQSTNAVTPVSPLNEQPAPNGVGGWTGAGGTSVVLRSGETLYNLSKRYGVPVREIMRVNNIANADTVQAGQRIVIPTYVYSQNAPVSAPDNNPETRAARASRGTLGQANPDSVIIPTRRPRQVAALSAENTDDAEAVLPSRKVKPWTEDTQENVPDYSIVTGSVNNASGTYTVVSGDTLSRIASRHNTTTSALMEHNNLSGTTIRIGQKLQIPAAATASSTPVTQAAPTQTRSVSQPKAYTKPTIDKTVTSTVSEPAPETTGFGKLRWPVSGRVVSDFGDTRNGQRNDGIDISVPEGTAVKAAENGVVIYSGSDLENFGNLVLIRHQDGLVTAYAHNKYNKVKKNDRVSRGQVIAASGRTGSASSPLLHFEVRKNSQPVDPKKYLGG